MTQKARIMWEETPDPKDKNDILFHLSNLYSSILNLSPPRIHTTTSAMKWRVFGKTSVDSAELFLRVADDTAYQLFRFAGVSSGPRRSPGEACHLLFDQIKAHLSSTRGVVVWDRAPSLCEDFGKSWTANAILAIVPEKEVRKGIVV